jgi:hypothetical protein
MRFRKNMHFQKWLINRFKDVVERPLRNLLQSIKRGASSRHTSHDLSFASGQFAIGEANSQITELGLFAPSRMNSRRRQPLILDCEPKRFEGEHQRPWPLAAPSAALRLHLSGSPQGRNLRQSHVDKYCALVHYPDYWRSGR